MGCTVIVAGLHAADDAEDDADSVEEFGEPDVSWSDDCLVGLVDARCDSAEQAMQRVGLVFLCLELRSW